MRLIKRKNEYGTTIILDEVNKSLRISFEGNGDLYYSLHFKNDNNETYFVITKENYGLYSLFEELFYDIENINISYDNDTHFYIEKEEKKQYRKFNHSNYNELYDSNNKIITWYSDETAHEVANILKIKQNEEEFILQFFVQPHLDGYDEDFHTANYIPIRFRNSGSSYEPFNIVFMKMYKKMKELDDVKDVGHQIHIEEYLYNQKKRLVKENKPKNYNSNIL